MVTKFEKSLYIFFTHWIDSKFLWCVHNLSTITFYRKNSIYYIVLFLQSKVQKIKQWLWLLMVHANMIIPNFYFLGPFFSQCTHGIFKLMSNLAFRFDELSKKWQNKKWGSNWTFRDPLLPSFFEFFKPLKFKSRNVGGLEGFIIRSPIVTPFFHLPLCNWSYFNTK